VSEERERLRKIAGSTEALSEERSGAMHAIAHSLINEGRSDLADEWFDRIIALPGCSSSLSGRRIRALCPIKQ